MKVGLIVPFASEDDRRHRIWYWVMRRWRYQFPEWVFTQGWSDPENFNRSEARNSALLRAGGADILVISDADTACEPAQVRAAIDLVANEEAPWVVAHTHYYSLTRDYTDRILEGPIDLTFPQPYESNWVMHSRSEAGVLVVRAKECVRWDERFIGWGYEDNAWAAEMNRTVGPYKRVLGDMFHLWHERDLDFDQPHIKENERLYKQIRDGS